MELAITATLDITERDELLNGTQSVTFAGESDDGRWSISGSVAWNLGLIDFPGEGDLVLGAEGDSSEIFATLTRAAARPDGEGGGETTISLGYEVDGGHGRYEGAAGRARGEVSILGDTLRGSWVLTLTEG